MTVKILFKRRSHLSSFDHERHLVSWLRIKLDCDAKAGKQKLSGGVVVVVVFVFRVVFFLACKSAAAKVFQVNRLQDTAHTWYFTGCRILHTHGTSLAAEYCTHMVLHWLQDTAHTWYFTGCRILHTHGTSLAAGYCTHMVLH